MPDEHGTRLGPLTASCAHLCIDMQNLFAEGTEWHTPWMKRVLPVVERIAAAHPERTIFTRFIPAARPG
ncbi:MAG TPA: cysteine hydrolase, partial [Roseomonas sp.]